MMKKKRIIACLIDFIIFILIVTLLGVIITNDLMYSNKMQIISLYMLVIYLLIKDLKYKSQSIGKKIMRIAVKNNDNTEPTIIKTMFRNITLILWPIEGIMLLIFGKRIGDIIFKTKVISIS